MMILVYVHVVVTLLTNLAIPRRGRFVLVHVRLMDRREFPLSRR